VNITVCEDFPPGFLDRILSSLQEEHVQAKRLEIGAADHERSFGKEQEDDQVASVAQITSGGGVQSLTSEVRRGLNGKVNNWEQWGQVGPEGSRQQRRAGQRTESLCFTQSQEGTADGSLKSGVQVRADGAICTEITCDNHDDVGAGDVDDDKVGY